MVGNFQTFLRMSSTTTYQNFGSFNVLHNTGTVKTITINGKTVGQHLTGKKITKFTILADGDILDEVDVKAGVHLNITAESVGEVKTSSGDVTLHGAQNINRISTMSGSVVVHGSLDHVDKIDTMSGSVKCGGKLVAGKISTMFGNVRASNI